MLKYVQFEIFNHRTAEKDEFFGQGIVSLKEALKNSPQPFSCFIYCEGKKIPHSQISGYYHIHEKDLLQTSGCKCHTETFQNIPQQKN